MPKSMKITSIILILLTTILMISLCQAESTDTNIPTETEKPDYTSITLVNNSTTGFTYVPWGSQFQQKNQRFLTDQGKSSSINQFPKHIEVPSGSFIDQSSPNKIIIKYNNSVILELDTLPQNNNKRNLVESDMWLIWATILPKNIHDDDTITQFSTTWNVPKGQDNPVRPIFIFNGIQGRKIPILKLPPEFKGGILQPVLTHNCGDIKQTPNTCTGSPSSNTWSGAAVYSPPRSTNLPDIRSKDIPAKQKDTVKGDITWDENEKKWTVTFTNLNTGKSSYININNAFPPNHKYIEPVFAYENYHAQYPQYQIKGNITFANIKLKHWLGLQQIKSNIETGHSERLTNNTTWSYDTNHYFVETTKWPYELTLKIPPSDIS